MLIDALGFGDWDAFLLAGRYTLLEQAPLDDLIPLCQSRGTSLVIGGPLNSGILAGRDTWNYDTAPPEIVARVQKIAAVCKAHNVPLPAAALQFPLAHPVVAAVIPGPRNATEFNENLPLFTLKIPRQPVDRSAQRTPAAPKCPGAGLNRNVHSHRHGRAYPGHLRITRAGPRQPHPTHLNEGPHADLSD